MVAGTKAMETVKAGFRSANQGLAERLACLHDEIKQDFDGVNRIAVAVYDQRTDLLRSFVDSSEGDNPFEHTMARLSELKPLLRLAKTGGRRVVNDLMNHQTSMPAHLKRLLRGGYMSSYTCPIVHRKDFQGFLFLNSFQVGYFTPDVVRRLRPHCEVVCLNTVMELETIRMIQAAVRTIHQLSQVRDEETGGHLERMARYARIIAQRLAPQQGLSDEFVEFLYQFAPLHDVGKVAVPDNILFKAGRLDPAEWEVMKGHVARGIAVVDVMAETFNVVGAPYMRVLRNVVAHHHECIDGSGYPAGLVGGQISLEGRICAVADVFDALTSRRPYKDAWSNEDAIAYLVDQRGTRFDPDCVDIFQKSMAAVVDIQRRVAEVEID
jgi:hypothetical protein